MDNKIQQIVTQKYGEDFFGALTPYISDIDITDINCNGKAVWVNHVSKGRYKLEDIKFDETDIRELAYRISNTENVQFNKTNPELSADLDDLRFHFTHDSFSISGFSVSIRKTPITSRINEKSIKGKEVDYISDKAMTLLTAIIQSRLNTVICGLTGSGKTELVKYLMRFTKSSERIITIEDTSELHLPQIYPEKDIVELKVNEHINYEGAIKSCMRMLPVWLLLSEARGPEVKDLLKCISTGAKICTTIHADNAHQIPSRVLNMFEDNELNNEKIENMIFDFVDIGIHIKAVFGNRTIRYVDQIVYFEIDKNGKRICHDLYTVKKDQDGNYNYYYNAIPDSLRERLEDNDFYIFNDWINE